MFPSSLTRTNMNQRPNTHILFVFILFAALAVRLIMICLRGINPDEGAHLMDARLFLEGLLPVVDYGARQPVYVAFLAGMLNIFGTTLSAGRLLPVLSSIAGGAVLYMIGKRLYSPRTGLVAGTLYLFCRFL